MALLEHLYGQIKPQLVTSNVLRRFAKTLHVSPQISYSPIKQVLDLEKNLHAKNLKNQDVQHVIREKFHNVFNRQVHSPLIPNTLSSKSI
jgi:hypothetical protein